MAYNDFYRLKPHSQPNNWMVRWASQSHDVTPKPLSFRLLTRSGLITGTIQPKGLLKKTCHSTILEEAF